MFPIPIELIRLILAAPVPMPAPTAHNGTPPLVGEGTGRQRAPLWRSSMTPAAGAAALPLGYGWGYRSWGPPYPSYIQRRRHAAAMGGNSTFNHRSSGLAVTSSGF